MWDSERERERGRTRLGGEEDMVRLKEKRKGQLSWV